MSTRKISITEIILWILAILLILLALTPFALGFQIKSDYSRLMSEISEDFDLDLQIQQYDQGMYSSSVVISLKIPDIDEPILFREEVIHGPFYFGLLNQGKSPLVAAVIKGRLDIAADRQAMVDKIFAGRNPLVYQSVVDFAGDIDSQFYIPAVDTNIDGETGPLKIQSAGVILNERYSSGSKQISGEALLPVIRLTSADFSMNAESMNLSFSAAKGSNDIFLGDSVVSVNLLDINSGHDQFALRDLTIRSLSSENGNLINSGLQLSVREILASNQKLGPMQFNISVNGLNAASMLRIQEIENEMQEKASQGIPEEQLNAMMMGQMMGLMPELIKQAEIKVNPLSVNSELGKLEADMEFKLDGIDENTPADPMFLMGAINLELNVSIDEPLLKQLVSWELQNRQIDEMHAGSEASREIEANIPIEQQVKENIQGMLDENWLVLNEGVYMSSISMHQGELIINDKSVDPMQQMMSTMGDGDMGAMH